MSLMGLRRCGDRARVERARLQCCLSRDDVDAATTNPIVWGTVPVRQGARSRVRLQAIGG